MPQQLTLDEQDKIDRMLRSSGGSAMDALRSVNSVRQKKGAEVVSKCTIYRFVNDCTYKRGKKEACGGKNKVLTKKDVDHLDKVRKRLLKSANNTRRVTYKEILKAAGFDGKCCPRVAQDALRSRGIRFRALRRKVCLTDEDAKLRLKAAKEWVKRPKAFWVDNVHAYVDNKAWPMPLTPQQKERYRKTRVTGRLRKAQKGVARGCTKPRDKHSFLGIPSVTISAAVAKDKTIMWHVVGKSWNGTVAADMYSGPLAKALEKTWGKKKKYTIVEDGDRKGNQSGLGLKAKEFAKMCAMALPPRTPSWMPLDYAIWTAIEKKMDETALCGVEGKDAFSARLKRSAMKLPRGFVRKVIERMKGNIQGVVEARGYHAKDD